jgi:hypothetical protein
MLSFSFIFMPGKALSRWNTGVYFEWKQHSMAPKEAEDGR